MPSCPPQSSPRLEFTVSLSPGGSRKVPRRMRAVSRIIPPLGAIAIGVAVAVALFVGVRAAGTYRVESPPPWCPLDVSSQITVPTPGPTHNASPGSPASIPNGTVLFAASASGCVSPYIYDYSFGDGTSSQEPVVTHVYPGPGYYSGSLTVQASSGYRSTSYFCVDAHAWPALNVDSGNPAPPCP